MSLDRLDPGAAALMPAADVDPADMGEGELDRLAGLFKALGHGGRLAILCHLASGEKSVTELERLLGQRQAAVSQQLARLRLEGMVTTRREGKVIHYALLDPRVRILLQALPALKVADPA